MGLELLELRVEEELHIRRHTSLYSTLQDVFGREFCHGLKEIDFAKGKLRLTGFLSSIETYTSLKVFTDPSHLLNATPCIQRFSIKLWFYRDSCCTDTLLHHFQAVQYLCILLHLQFGSRDKILFPTFLNMTMDCQLSNRYVRLE